METPIKLWSPSQEDIQASQLKQFWDFAHQGEIDFPSSYSEIWEWSVKDVRNFWLKVLNYNEVTYKGDKPSLDEVFEGDIEHARWFPGLSTNYALHVLRGIDPDKEVLISVQEDMQPRHILGKELLDEVARLRSVYIDAGICQGDCIAAFVPNTEHAIYGFLAAASLGAVWSSCSPDFGSEAVLDRFRQLSPKLLIACTSYGYGGKKINRADVIQELKDQLPSVELALQIRLNDTDEKLEGWTAWSSTPNQLRDLDLAQISFVGFNDPLWVLFSSGTTGKPKAIVHSHGGCLLEHYKYLTLQADVRPGERFFWFTTTGWMMWNFLQASMLCGAVPVLYDGSPGYPALTRLWRLASELPIQHFGTSAPFIHACFAKNLKLSEQFDLSALRSIGSTGAPLSPEGFSYVYEHISKRVWLTSMSGGTDVCTAFVGGNIMSPVFEGVIQGRALGCSLKAYDVDGVHTVNTVGELVVDQPMPSMPIYFLNDPEGKRRHSSYFDTFDNVWRHGDWITVDDNGGIVIHGRSDATLNRQGVRIGTAEIYRVVDTFTELEDSIIINYQSKSGKDEMPLFVKMSDGTTLSDELVKRIKKALREGNSPRHVPTRIEAVADIPYTISGKKLEAPVKRLFLGHALKDVANLGALRNPSALVHFSELAAIEVNK